LTKVNFLKNACIDEEFDDQQRIAVLQQRVDEKCGFEETKSLSTAAPETINVSTPADSEDTPTFETST
jgi:hypothetical protein